MADLLIIAILVIVAIVSATVVVLPPVSLTLVVTACGILLAWRGTKGQRELAEQKLLLDMIPRRAQWYETLKSTISARLTELDEQIEVILLGQMPGTPTHLMMLHQLETEAKWLFGDEMTVLVARLIAADDEASRTKLDARTGNMEAARSVFNKVSAIYAAQSAIQDYLVNFLYVGDIGRPKRHPVQFINAKPWWKRLLKK